MDYLEANDYDKGIAVAFLYKALEHPEALTLEGFTLSFVSSTHPRAMLAMLRERGVEIKEKAVERTGPATGQIGGNPHGYCRLSGEPI